MEEKLELYRKYRPTTLDQMVGNEATIKSLKKELENGSHTFLFTGNAGCGKAQPLDSLVLTKSGYVKMGDVFEGMNILDGKGNETKINNIFPQGKRDIYKITFNDRSSIKVADNHINRVFWYNQNKKVKEYFDLSTLELIDKFKESKYKLRVDVPVIDCWENNDLPIDPYLLGILIADGSLNNNFNITIKEDDIKDKVSEILSKIDYQLNHINNYDYRIVRKNKVNCNQFVCDEDGLRHKIKTLGLNCKSIHKHIPVEYLYTSLENRLALLRGLFDGDGYISKNNGYWFDVCSKRLSDDFSFLVRSLGIVDTVSQDVASYKLNGEKKETSICYKHYLRVPNNLIIYSSNKHSDRRKVKQTEPIRKIESIEFVGKEECQCIYVQSDEHTYITDNMTVTHNTTLARIIAKEVGAGELSIREINSADNRGIDTAREVMEQMRFNPSDGDALVWILDEVHMITSAGQNAFLKALEDTPSHCYFFLCTTNPEKLIAPLKTRCSIINVKPLEDKEMQFLLKRTCRAEGVKLNPEIIEKIISIADGGSRKALKLLAKVLYLDSDEERLEVLKSDDVAESQETIELCRALLSKDCSWSKVSNILKNMDMSEPEKIRMAVMGYMNSVLLNGKMHPNAICALQAFGQNPTYNNGKFQITIACLDTLDLMEN